MPTTSTQPSSRASALSNYAKRARVMATVFTAGIAAAACYNFNILDTNGQTLQGLSNPTAASVSAAMTGLFSASRQDIQALIWRVGSMGREAINLSGNNQPDYQEPYFGPLSSTQFGGSIWGNEYSAIRDANIIIDGAPKAPDMTKAQIALTLGVAQTIKAQMFMYVAETRAQYGAPVNVDIPTTASPAPFVSQDSVWATIIYTLDSALTNLAAGASGNFVFQFPNGYATFGFNNVPQFRQFTWALLAKAWCERATVTSPPNAAYYANALHPALDSSFLSTTGNFLAGPYYDFSSGPGDSPNTLSEPLSGNTFYADTFNVTDAQRQTGGALDQRVLSKIAAIDFPTVSPGGQGGIPQIQGWLKFTVYFVSGSPNTAAPIPIIRNEELILLQAEALLGTGNIGGAVTDLNIVRTQSGNLPAYSGPMTTAAVTNELLYDRRFSLLWEQGTRWIDARRFGLLTSTPPAPPPTGIELGWDTLPPPAPGPPANWPAPTYQLPNVPTIMPIPNTECLARGLGSTCDPLGT